MGASLRQESLQARADLRILKVLEGLCWHVVNWRFAKMMLAICPVPFSGIDMGKRKASSRATAFLRGSTLHWQKCINQVPVRS